LSPGEEKSLAPGDDGGDADGQVGAGKLQLNLYFMLLLSREAA